MRAWVVAVVAGVCLVIFAYAVLRTERPSRAHERRAAPPAEGAVPASPPAPPATAEAPDPLGIARLPGCGAEDAAALRRLLRTDAGALASARAALLDPSTPREARMVLAIVLGTLSGNDDALLDAMGRFADDAGFVRCALVALGATREPEDDDDVFDLGDRPWGEKGPGALGITVRRAIDDAIVRNAIASRLESDAEEVRRAAAVALRHSLASADARRAFLSRLEREGSDDVAMVLGEGLAVRAGDEAEPGARSEIVAALLRRAGEEGFHGYRFRMEDDFQRIALGPAERETLADLARGPHPFGVRSFAMSALGAEAMRGGAGALVEARGLLGACLADDPDAAVRDLAARLLGKLPPDEGTLTRLARAASTDSAWRVRYAAVEALGASGRGALEALRAASADPDERVAARARELTRELEPR